MSLGVYLFAAFLFFILSPTILIRIPSNGSKYVVAGVHALVFGLVFYFTHNFFWNMESFQEGVKWGRIGKQIGKMLDPR